MALIQTKTNTGTSSTLATTWTSNTTTGNTILVFVSTSFAAFSSVTGIADSQSNTYTQVDKITSGVGNDDVECWIAQNINGGTTPTVTVTFSGLGQNEGVIMAEYGGVLSASLDVHTLVAQTGTSNVITGPTTSTTTNANDYVIAYATFSVLETVTPGTGYGNLVSMAAASGQMAFEDKSVSSTGTQTATFNVNSGNAANVGFGMVTLKQAATVVPQYPAPIVRIANKYVGPMALRYNFRQAVFQSFAAPSSGSDSIVVSDSTATSETLTLTNVYGVIATDSTTVTETVTLSVPGPDLFILVDPSNSLYFINGVKVV